MYNFALKHALFRYTKKKTTPFGVVFMVDDTRLELVTSRTSSGCATSCANRPGGDKRDRTADLLNAIQALSQLSYTPVNKRYYSRNRIECQAFFVRGAIFFRLPLFTGISQWPFSVPLAPTPKWSSFIPSTSSQIPFREQIEQSVGRPSRIVVSVFVMSLAFFAVSFIPL